MNIITAACLAKYNNSRTVGRLGPPPAVSDWTLPRGLLLAYSWYMCCLYFWGLLIFFAMSVSHAACIRVWVCTVYSVPDALQLTPVIMTLPAHKRGWRVCRAQPGSIGDLFCLIWGRPPAWAWPDGLQTGWASGPLPLFFICNGFYSYHSTITPRGGGGICK